MNDAFLPIEWTCDAANPVVRPGLNGEFDAERASAGCVLDLGETYRMYYWASGTDENCICAAESPVDSPNDWRPLGRVLGAQPETAYNCRGPRFPWVTMLDERTWHMYVLTRSTPKQENTFPSTLGLAVSDDAGATWRYVTTEPLIGLEKPYENESTGSVCVVKVDDEFRMYYTAVRTHGPKPLGARCADGDHPPRIGIAYALSDDGVHWRKPYDEWLIAPRGFAHDPYEHYVAKPCAIRDGDGWRMWVSARGTAYRVRSLTSRDGLHWTWTPSGEGGEIGTGAPGAFDDAYRCYAHVVRHGDEYRMWYSGNGFGAAGMGYAIGRL